MFKLFLLSYARSVRHKMVAKTIQNIVIHYKNQELQPGSTDQLSRNTLKARRDLIQIKHHFPIFSFRYLKYPSLCLYNWGKQKAEQRNRMHKSPISQAAHPHTPQVKWPCIESKILRHQPTPCYCWRHKLGRVGFQHEVHRRDFSPSPKSMPGARINRCCGVSNRSLSPLPL